MGSTLPGQLDEGDHRASRVTRWRGACIEAGTVHTIVVSSIACVLLIAAGLKLESLQFEPTMYPLLSYADVFHIAGIAAEMFLAGWLLSGVAANWARRVTLVLLTIFLCAAAWRWYSGEARCGCFGSLAVHPSRTIALDVGMLLALWSLAPKVAARNEMPISRNVIASATALCAVSGICLVAHQIRSDGAPGQMAVVLDPQSWMGHQFPLLDYIDGPSRASLSAGCGTVVIVDHTCHKCTNYLSELQARTGTGPTWVIDLGPPSIATTRRQGGLLEVFLRPGPIYALEVPLAVRLRDGRVESVHKPG